MTPVSDGRGRPRSSGSAGSRLHRTSSSAFVINMIIRAAAAFVLRSPPFPLPPRLRSAAGCGPAPGDCASEREPAEERMRDEDSAPLEPTPPRRRCGDPEAVEPSPRSDSEVALLLRLPCRLCPLLARLLDSAPSERPLVAVDARRLSSLEVRVAV
eukprot:CAMPEP_0185164618 /NCGR_PEP_ID=MMETSP1139-20130426/9651_1 /TAXON_ID=298111 /ORGANISM="Pavlova sp., Strain CCMP459" /LENGTH=155 /DNA_ID=CAMNT_0027729997 /DNA_START=42 /DNA_END=506 /DNA_ORIENTATION=-